MRNLLAAAMLGLSAIAVPVSAQETVSEEEAAAKIPHYREMKAAIVRGREMYFYDQAAWHATDRMLEDWGERPTTDLRGYIVLPGEGDGLDAVFFGEQEGKTVEFARYRVEGSKVVGGGPADEDARPELSPLGRRMVAARGIALDEARQQEFGFCNRERPNTLILPPDADDIVSVYFLTAPVSNDAYPVGGHFRIDVDAAGKVTNSRRFLNTCFVAEYGKAAGGDDGRPVALVLSHLLDPQPTEIHVFASYYIPVDLMVVTTENELLWSVARGNIGFAGSLDDIEKKDD
jgi:hypothetical protein